MTIDCDRSMKYFNSNDLGKERQNLMNERDRQNKLLQTLQGELHDMQLKERDLASILREKENMEENIAQWKKDIETYQENVKVLVIFCSEVDAKDFYNRRSRHFISKRKRQGSRWKKPTKSKKRISMSK